MQVAVAVNKRKQVLIETEKVFPQSIDVVKTRASVIGIQLIETKCALSYLKDPKNKDNLSNIAAVVTQTPDNAGTYSDISEMTKRAHEH